MKQLLCAAVAALAMYGCALPNTTVQSGQGRPTLRVVGAPPQSVLMVDGIQVGQASAFDGVQSVLKIEEGPHEVEVRQGGRALLTRSIFASGGESVSIEVSAEQQQ
ncbi:MULTISPECIES: hypothetical protein [Cupriavidus]|uniref:hypothetical protein n=1 Tax=Cupriavidus sp. DF5525 TaxID=3160989 RepID=UPI0003B00BB8|nr:hypothetical protein N234_29940 [Ralstonia pickettii DTP0602]